jgi:hypothetical protein
MIATSCLIAREYRMKQKKPLDAAALFMHVNGNW